MPISVLSEEDLTLLHALQIHPRATWTALSDVLERSPAALAARWSRLRSSGLAWVTVHPVIRGSGTQMAFVEVDCLPTRRDSVLETLSASPEIISIEISARGRDLFLTVVSSDWTALSDLILTRLQVDGILRHRASLVTAIHQEGSDWRLDALNSEQIAAVTRIEATDTPCAAREGPVDTGLLDFLVADGRMTFTELARVSGRSTSSVRRQFSKLVASDSMRFRCEVSQESSRWPICCTWFCRVDPRQHAETAQFLRTVPEIRGCFSVAGDANFMFTAWTRSVGDLLRIERHIAQARPTLRLVDSAVALATRKRLGWLLDAAGCATGEIVAPRF
nr:Lrp/AsnC ligand binding domain-containing protein [Jiangella endophytica]